MSNGSTAIIQNCQVIKSNKTYTMKESPKGSAKDRMRLHELSYLLERDSQSVFFTKKITKRGKESHKDFIIFMIQILLHCIARYKAYIYCVSRWSLHASFHSSECFPKLMLYIKLYVHRFLLICQLPKSNELCFPKLMLSRSQPLAFI